MIEAAEVDLRLRVLRDFLLWAFLLEDFLAVFLDLRRDFTRRVFLCAFLLCAFLALRLRFTINVFPPCV